MATVLDEFMITIGVDPSKMQQGIKQAAQTVQSATRQMSTTISSSTKGMATGFGRVTKSVTAMGAGIKATLGGVTGIFTGFSGALLGIFSVGAAFSTWKEQAAEFGGVAKRLHMSIEDVQGWAGAIGKFGGSSSDLEGTLRGLNGQLAKMATLGKSRTGTLLQSLGIDAGEVGRQRDALDVLQDLAGVMEQMSPEESKGIGAALGLDPSTIMLLQQGRDGMKDLIAQKKQDAVYTQEDADTVKAYNVEMGKVKKGFIGVASILFRMVLPAFTTVTKYVGQFVNFLRRHQTAVKAFFVMIATVITAMLIPSFLAFARALMTNPITWVILAIAALALVIEDFIVWLDGGKSALDKFWRKLLADPETAKKNLEDIKAKAIEFVETVKQKFEEFIQWVEENPIFTGVVIGLAILGRIAPTVISILSSIGSAFRLLGNAVMFVGRMILTVGRFMLANPILAAIMAVIFVLMDLYTWATTGESALEELWTALFGDPEHFMEIIDECKQFFENAWNTATKFVADKWQWLNGIVDSVCEAIKAAVSAVGEFIMSSIGSAIDWIVDKWNALKALVGGGISAPVVNTSFTGFGGGNSYDNSSSVYNNTYNLQGERAYQAVQTSWDWHQSNSGS